MIKKDGSNIGHNKNNFLKVREDKNNFNNFTHGKKIKVIIKFT